MNRKIMIIITIALLILACSTLSPSSEDIETAIAQTQAAQASPSEMESPVPTNTTSSTEIIITSTSEKPTEKIQPTKSPEPTIRLTATLSVDTSKAKAKNYIDVQDSSGVSVEVSRILIADKTAVPIDFNKYPIFHDKPVVVEIIFSVSNTTDKTVHLYINQGKVAINGEQINLFDYALQTPFGDNVLNLGAYLPGVTSKVTYWIGIKRTEWNEVSDIIIDISPPIDLTNPPTFFYQGYFYKIDASGWTFEPFPDELR